MRLARSTVIWTATLALLWAGVASGHAYLKTSDPTDESTVAVAPKEVRLTFTEPVEVRFSIFKVYRLDADLGLEMRRINAAAGALMSDVLVKRGDDADRADAGLDGGARATADVVIKMKADARPGAYAVMWRVLSIDTHTTQGFYVYFVGPKR